MQRLGSWSGKMKTEKTLKQGRSARSLQVAVLTQLPTGKLFKIPLPGSQLMESKSLELGIGMDT